MEKILEFNSVEALEVLIRSVLSLVSLFLITKLLGKKQVSQLSLFDYVVGISIGNFAAEISINIDTQYVNGVIGVLVFGIIAYLISILSMKSIKLRRFFIGVPTILIQKGNILEKNLKKVKFDVNDLLQECRIVGYFDISQIDYAIMEANGQISILSNAKDRPITPKDMNIKVDKDCLFANIIIDGNLMHNNIKNMNKDVNWVLKELKIKGYELDDVLLATLDENDKMTIYERNYNKKIHNILEWYVFYFFNKTINNSISSIGTAYK